MKPQPDSILRSRSPKSTNWYLKRGFIALARIIGVVLLTSAIFQFSELYSRKQFDKRYGAYRVVEMKQAHILTMVEVELATAANEQQLKQWGDQIKQSKSPHKSIVVYFFTDKRSEDSYLANYQDGRVEMIKG